MNKSENFVNLSTDSLTDKKKSSHVGLILIVICSIAVLFGTIWAVRYHYHAAAEPADTSRSRGGSLPVPVVTGSVKQKDVPIYLDGLGTVQALNSVAIRSRVDGQLIKVAFTEGQDVKAGDLLVQIDPAPYQALLDQTVAKKAQDEAQLANALIDLKRYTTLIATNSISGQVYDTQKALADQRKAAVRIDDAAIDSAKVNLNYTTIRAPIDGRTGIRGVDQGNIVLANDPSPLAACRTFFSKAI